jgi:hypothetical protein
VHVDRDVGHHVAGYHVGLRLPLLKEGADLPDPLEAAGRQLAQAVLGEQVRDPGRLAEVDQAPVVHAEPRAVPFDQQALEAVHQISMSSISEA